jgi:hypothetical protein
MQNPGCDAGVFVLEALIIVTGVRNPDARASGF